MRTGLLAGVRHDGRSFQIALADLSFPADSELGPRRRRLPALAGAAMTERPAPAAVIVVLGTEEKAAMLDRLVAADADLEGPVSKLALSLLTDVSVDVVAATVADALRALDQDELAARAGPMRFGYVEPTQAAWELLEEAREPWLEDIGRRAGLGLVDAAIVIASGAISAPRSVEGCDHDQLLLSWAPDFPAEGVSSACDALLRAGIGLAEPSVETVLAGWR